MKEYVIELDDADNVKRIKQAFLDYINGELQSSMDNLFVVAERIKEYLTAKEASS